MYIKSQFEIINASKPIWKIEILPTVVLELNRKPSLWARFGIWVWFGLRGKDIKEHEG